MRLLMCYLWVRYQYLDFAVKHQSFTFWVSAWVEEKAVESWVLGIDLSSCFSLLTQPECKEGKEKAIWNLLFHYMVGLITWFCLTCSINKINETTCSANLWLMLYLSEGLHCLHQVFGLSWEFTLFFQVLLLFKLSHDVNAPFPHKSRCRSAHQRNVDVRGFINVTLQMNVKVSYKLVVRSSKRIFKIFMRNGKIHKSKGFVF